MGGAYDARMAEQSAQQQAAQNAQLYNPDGSAKANDYHPPRLPASAFPALDGGHELEVHRDRLTQVATQMSAELGRLQATLQQLFGAGGGGAGIAGWPTAEAFGVNAGSAYTGISQFYQDLNTAYDLVIGNLHKTAGNYADAESAAAAAAAAVGTDSAAPGILSPGA